MTVYLATTLYDDDDETFYHQVGLPGDTTPGTDVVTGDPVGTVAVVAGDQTAIVHLTNSTGIVPDDTIAAVPAVVAAAGEATAADLTTTQAALAVIADSLSDLAGKVEQILDALEASGHNAAPV